MSLFAQLSVIDGLQLHRRLRLSLSDDPIASRFARFGRRPTSTFAIVARRRAA